MLASSRQTGAEFTVDADYSIDVYEGENAFHLLKDDWEKLWWLSEEATETQSWQWQYLYWKYLAPTTRPIIITAKNSRGRRVAIAPFFICRDKSSWLSKAAFLGDKRPDYHLILAEPCLTNSVGYKILDHLVAKVEKSVPIIELSNIPCRSYTAAVVEKLFSSSLEDRSSRTARWEWQTYAVPLPQTLDDYLKQLGPRSRRDFRYDRKKLCKDFNVKFKVYSSSDDLTEALDAIERVDRARWGSNSRYCVASERSFERSVARAFCEMGIYRSFVLYLNDKPCAFVTGAVVRNALKVAAIGFDKSTPGRLSVGKIANFYTIEDCIERGYKEYDLTRGGEEYKKWLGAIPSTNLHIRRYRSRVDEWLDSTGKTMVSALRNQNWLRSIYQVVLRK